MMNFVSGCLFFAIFKNSKPFIWGMEISRKTISGKRASTSDNASFPFSAFPTKVQLYFSQGKCSIAVRMGFSSSTRRTFMFFSFMCKWYYSSVFLGKKCYTFCSFTNIFVDLYTLSPFDFGQILFLEEGNEEFSRK